MMKLLGFAAIAGLALTSAAPPVGELDSVNGPEAYPPCSRTVTDNCVQLYERGVREERRATANQGGPLEDAPATASAAHYPRCSATVTDRCTQTSGKRYRSAVRTARMVRAGERG